MKHDPWNELQAPKQFKRTDTTGRRSPLVTDDDEPLIPDWLFLRILWCVAGVVSLILLALAMHVNLVV